MAVARSSPTAAHDLPATRLALLDEPLRLYRGGATQRESIGGDGCKWRVTGGPGTADNGGSELKLQLLFIHSGVDGGQPQGSYFVVMEKGGQRLPIPDSVRSVALSDPQWGLERALADGGT